MRSLTHDEAQRRAESISVSAYDVRLDLTGDGETFRSSSTIRFTARRGKSTFVDVKPRVLHSVTLNGRPVDAECADARLALDALSEQNELVVDATMAYSHDGEGLHRHFDPADGRAYLYAMSFLDAAPRWFACFDQPDLKAPFALHVICPPEWAVAGNAPASQAAPGQWRLATEHPIATYFATLVAGPYRTVRSEHDGICLALHARASRGAQLDEQAPELFEITRACLDEFHRLFGIRYPWGEYHQAFVPDFNAGAMENPGCVTLRDSLLFRSRVTDAERAARASTIAHEMAHMWFGDLVTMRWWDDLWLNESFAEYLGTRVSDRVTEHPAWVEFGIVRKSWGHAADRRPSTHPVAGNGAADAASALDDFDGISYAKGASVLAQLAARLGDDVFLGGLRRYFRTHAYGNAQFADLLEAWTAAGATDLASWAESWLRTAGLDTLRVAGNGLLRESSAEVDREHTVDVIAYDPGGEPVARLRASAYVRETELDLPDAALVLPDAGDQTWAKIGLRADEWARLPRLLPTLSDPRARVVIWNALRLAVADAEVDPRSALDIVTAVLPTEPVDAIVADVLRWAHGSLVGRYLSGGAAVPGAFDQLADTAERTLTAAPPSSGRQLAAARGWAAATADARRLRDWLGGSVPAGLGLDVELRWSVLRRLAALGVLTADELDAESARDATAQGGLHAATCRTLCPDPAAKERAWRTLVSDADRANSELYAIAEGFWHPEQRELTAPFVARYFEEIPATAALRSGWVVGTVASRAYPWTAVHGDTLARTEALLARDDLDRHIRRSVTDAGDDLRRAVVARERFGLTLT